MAERYGIPYKGSKNQIAEWVVDNLPPAANLYDLFCGGCAVTHRAMIAHKYDNYIINDIDADLPKLFVDALNGKFANYSQWVSYNRIKGLQCIADTPNADKLQCYYGSYDNVEIKPNSVIYCDIPYYGTDDYVNSGFSHRDFYQWATRQEVPVFISEYYAPEELFTCVAQIEKSVLLGSGSGNKKIEKIFVPKNQKIIEHGQLKMF